MPRNFSSKNHLFVRNIRGDFKRRIDATVKVIDIEPAKETDSVKNEKKIPTNRDILNDFLESTSIHGLQYFGKTDVKIGVFGKILWTFTMLAGFACSTVMVIQFLNRYNENPTNTFITSFNNPIFEAPFPAVTLCPLSPISLDRQLKVLDGINIPANMSTKTVMDLLKYGHFIAFPYAMESYEGGELAELLKANHWTIADFLKILEPCEDILVACWWSSERIDCGKSIVLSHSSYGFCCSFNYLLEELVGRDKNQPTPRPIRSVDYGRRSGLKILIHKRMLNTDTSTNESSLYSKSISNNDGIAVLIHHSFDFPGLNTNTYILQKNTELQLNVKPTMSAVSEDLYGRNRNGKVVPLCVHDSDTLEYFPVYSYSNCYADCRVNAMIRICGCLPYIYEHLVAYHHVTLCELEGLTCIQKNAKQISIIRDVRQPNLTCSCKTPCEEVVYSVRPVVIDLTRSESATSYKNVSTDDAILRVFTVSQVFPTTETVSAADEVYLLASIGGIFSLFLGSSFLSVVEILYFVKLFCHVVYLRRKNESSAKERKRASYEDYEDTRRRIY